VKKRLLLILIVALLTVAGDQAAKWWARSSLKGGPAVVLVPGYLELEYHENPGSAFGLFRNVPGARFILIGVGLGALALVWTMVRKIERGKLAADLAFALVAGGAVGNLLDRIYQGRVSDFVVMHWQRKFTWPAYNVADVALVVGVGLLLLVVGRKPEKAAAGGRAKTKSKSKASR
jgi:signal peptidase II